MIASNQNPKNQYPPSTFNLKIVIIDKNLHKPLTQVPDPFEKFASFGEHNNEMLKDFLNSFNFKYSFIS